MPEYDIALELAKLHILKGADFVRQLKMLAGLSIFRAIDNETEIFSTGGEQGEDYEHLLNAARKAVTHGYKVYILPNPNKVRTADFIFERKGIYKMYDLKTIQGHNSAFNRLVESIGQVNHVSARWEPSRAGLLRSMHPYPSRLPTSTSAAPVR